MAVDHIYAISNDDTWSVVNNFDLFNVIPSGPQYDDAGAGGNGTIGFGIHSL